MATPLNLVQSNQLVASTVPVNDIVSNLNDIWSNFQQVQTAFNALNSEVDDGIDVGGNEHFTEVSYNPSTQILRFVRQNGRIMNVSLASTQTLELSELNLTDIGNNIDETVSLVGNHTLTYHVSGFGVLTQLFLYINEVQVHQFTNPTSDGQESVTYNISSQEWTDITNGDPGTLAFQIRDIDNSVVVHTSNTVTVTRVNDAEKIFYALSSTNNPASIDTSTMQSHVLQQANTTFSVTLGPTTAGQYIIFLYPNNNAITSIRNQHFGNRDVLNTFTVTQSVRTIESQAFSSAVFGPVNAGLTQQYEIATTAE